MTVMARTNVIILCLAALVALNGCDPGIAYDVSGTWPEGEGRTIYLTDEGGVVTDSAMVQGGAFRLGGRLPGIVKRTLVAGNHTADIILDGVAVTADVTTVQNRTSGRSYEKVTINGSIEQKILQEGDNLAMGRGVIGLGEMILLLKYKDDQQKRDSVSIMARQLSEQHVKNIRALLDTITDNYAAAYIIAKYIDRGTLPEDPTHYYDRLSVRVKMSPQGQLLKAKIDSLHGAQNDPNHNNN